MNPLKIAYNKYIPFRGYIAITLFDVMFVREEYKDTQPTQETKNHEMTHKIQVRDYGIGFAGYFIFYTEYLLEWLLKLPFALFGYKPYRSIAVEQEAYNNQKNPDYNETRKRFAGLKYVFKLVK